jgi:hypothetical protein
MNGVNGLAKSPLVGPLIAILQALILAVLIGGGSWTFNKLDAMRESQSAFGERLTRVETNQLILMDERNFNRGRPWGSLE